MRGRGFAVQGVVWADVIEAVAKASTKGLQLVQAGRQVVAGVEFVAPGALRAFDRAVKLRAVARCARADPG